MTKQMLTVEREKVTLATQMVQIESKRANEAKQKVQTLVDAWSQFRNELAVYDIGFLRRNTRLTSVLDAALAKVEK